jgi:hypothetical protein
MQIRFRATPDAARHARPKCIYAENVYSSIDVFIPGRLCNPIVAQRTLCLRDDGLFSFPFPSRSEFTCPSKLVASPSVNRSSLAAYKSESPSS